MRVLFLVIGEFFAECAQLVLLHVRAAANDTQCLIDILRLGEEVQTAVDTRERQLFELAVQTDFMQQFCHLSVKRFQLLFRRGEHFLGEYLPCSRVCGLSRKRIEQAIFLLALFLLRFCLYK